MTDQFAQHEIAGHEIARQEIAGHENAGHENAGHETDGQLAMDKHDGRARSCSRTNRVLTVCKF